MAWVASPLGGSEQGWEKPTSCLQEAWQLPSWLRTKILIFLTAIAFFFFFSPFWRWSLQTFDLKSNISTSSVPFLPKEYGNNVGHQNYGTVGLNIPNIKNKSCSLDLKPIYCIDMGYYFKVIFTVVCDWMYLPVLRPGRNIEYCAIRNTILRADNLYLAVAVCLYLNLEINFSCTLDLFGFIHHKLMNDW